MTSSDLVNRIAAAISQSLPANDFTRAAKAAIEIVRAEDAERIAILSRAPTPGEVAELRDALFAVGGYLALKAFVDGRSGRR